VSLALKLKPNAKARVLTGHAWVFVNEVEELLPAEHDGEVVECRDRTGRFLGSGIYNSKSQIVWRRLSRERVTLDEAYLRAALERALDRRRELIAGRREEERFCRLIWSEADALPGVVLDQFDGTLVLQVQTLAMEKRAAVLTNLLAELLKPEEIIFRNDANIRRLEGLPLEVRTWTGRPWEPRWMKIDGVDYWLDLQGGQKTGFYLDQRMQHGAVARYVPELAAARPEGARVLDGFCNQGSFALHCARAGAARVLGLDRSEEAVAQARKNAERNGLRAGFEAVNMFDWFTAQRDGEQSWDVIVLDPPPFAKSKTALTTALRGYKELNLRAMKSLRSGGVLATYSCSHHVQDTDFRQVLAEAASDARRRVSVLEHCHQPPDHPVLVTMPETEYLRGYILRVE